MAFNPGLSIGQILKNADIFEKFKCGNIGGVLHYMGMGKNGDQDINWAQNAMKILAEKKMGGSKTVYVPPVIPKPQPKPTVVIPADIVSKKVGHKSFGTGVITAIDGGTIVVNFDKVDE